ncbi:MAG: GAF domain-containing sensor histidine kinase [Chloroflexi bacterium]|uniref:GAF domain-containing sensor histidine kinase n=1 Tax=Candidatus Flexifilum breve TaxID=3140694 RepID=UPI003134E6FF|nr:GAF domain-containing sensor histidine kinase [Chloroflexota bacterium]
MSDTDQLKKRNRELSILNTIAEALNREVDLSRALEAALNSIAALFNVQTGWIWLQREDTGATYLAAALNLPPGLQNDPASMEGNDCYCLEKYALGTFDTAANVSIITCTRLKYLSTDRSGGLRHHASVPLYHHDRRVGVLNVVSADWKELSDDDLRLLNTVGGMVSIAIERARLFDRSLELGAVEERNRLAREIHDTLAQGLAAIALQLETADAFMHLEKIEEAHDAVMRALTLARANMEEARRSVLDLRAAPLEKRSFCEALEALVEQFGAESGLRTSVELIGGQRPLPVRIEAGLYRIAQEALTNVARHADATQIFVVFTSQPEKVELVIEDDGQGFDPTALPKDRFGLIGLNERTRLLGGTFEVSTQAGEGTTLKITLPLESRT